MVLPRVLAIATIRGPVALPTVLLAGLLTVGCGGGSAENPPSTGGTGSGSGGVAATGGVSAGGGAAATDGNGAGGMGGTIPGGTGGSSAPIDPPLVDISGRWGMFAFEDPVGVQLFQAADGKLTGRGCDAGAPGDPAFDGLLSPDLCGDIAGEVRGRAASFGFTFQDVGNVRYSARVTISDDGRRMSGIFNNGMGGSATLSWLRVADGTAWLRRASVSGNPAWGDYALTLVAAADSGSEFVAGRTYDFTYSKDSIWGDLGCFWHSEFSPPLSPLTDGVIRVGPVPPTDPALPTSLSLEVDSGAIRSITATTERGGVYTFLATPQR